MANTWRKFAESVLKRFSNVGSVNGDETRKVRDRPADAEHAIDTARAHAELLHCRFEQTRRLGIQPAVLAQLDTFELAVQPLTCRAKSLPLNIARTDHTRPDVRRRFDALAGAVVANTRTDCRYLHHQIDAIPQRP